MNIPITKYILISFYLIFGPLSILIFSDLVITRNKLYLIFHIITCVIYFVAFYLYLILLKKINEINQIDPTDVSINYIPTAPMIDV